MSATAEARILLVDDDVELTAMLGDYLVAEGFAVSAIGNGEAAVPAAIGGAFDAVILDVMLPRLSGIEALRRIRQHSMVPVLMLTAKGDNIDRVVGLELGADDYVPKPYFPRELVARLRAVLRRRALPAPGTATPTRYACGALSVDPAARRARFGERELELTVSEFNLLVALMQAGDSVASKDELSLHALGRTRQSYDRSIDVHISNLRHKLDAGCDGALTIDTVRGIGYRLREGA